MMKINRMYKHIMCNFKLIYYIQHIVAAWDFMINSDYFLYTQGGWLQITFRNAGLVRLHTYLAFSVYADGWLLKEC